MKTEQIISKTALIIAVIALIVSISPRKINLGGTTSDNWNVGGNLAVTGTGTITGDFRMGTTTDTTDHNFVVANTTSTFVGAATNASTTLLLISETAATGGRIIIEDTDGAGCSEITVLNAVITIDGIACPKY